MRHRYLSALLNQPHLITPEAGAAVLAVLRPDAQLIGWDGDPGDDERPQRAYQVIDGVAIIPMVGELVHRAGAMNARSGLTSYQGLADMLAAAMHDPDVRGVLIDADSPGGAGAGCLDFAERVRAYRGVKPLWAAINQAACSAAYAIACAADRVLIGKDGLAGSIGVVAYHADISQALEEAGVVVTYLYAGARKIDAVREKPLSDPARKAIQGRIDQTYDRFCAVVAAHRGMTVEAVRATEAAVYRGEEAIRAGLADQISTMEDALAELAQAVAPTGARLGTQPAGGPGMHTQTPGASAPALAAPAQTAAGSDAVNIAQACQAAGFPELTAPLLLAGVSLADARTRIEEARQILDAGQRLGQADNARALIAEGVSLATAQRLLSNMKAGADAALQTDTTRPAVPAGGSGAQQGPAFDYGAIYGAMNKPMGVK